MTKFSLRQLEIIMLLIVAANGDIPDYIHVCHRNDPGLPSCIIDSIEALKPHLKVGIPELEVPPMEPLHLGDLNMKLESGDSKITHIQIWGASLFKIQNLSVDTSTDTFEYTVIVPKVYLQGQYEINTKLMFLPIKGQGPIDMNITDYQFDCAMKGHKIERNGENYMEFEKMNCDITFKDVTVYLGNLFNGNAMLGNATNSAINDNVNVFYKEVKPNLRGALENTFTDVANKITLRFRYNELFP